MKPQYKSYLTTLIISTVSVVIGLTFYHKYVAKPKIVFNDNPIAKNVSFNNDKYSTVNSFNFNDIAKQSLPSVVYISIVRKDKNGLYSNDSGSGVFISPLGQIVTNFHVIKDAEKIIVTTYDNKKYNAELIGKDDATDLAVIKIPQENSHNIRFGNSEEVQIGDWIMLIGNPFKLKNSISAGIISAKNRTLNILESNGIESYIQTDATANPGNSGGAMVDNEGKLIGIVAAISTITGNFQGFSFAIPSNIVKKVVSDLINFGVVQRAWMGVTIKNIEGRTGVKIERINKNSAAQNANIHEGDLIISINNIDIKNVAHFEGIISQYKPGDKIDVKLLHNNKEFTKSITLKNNLNTTDLIANRNDKILTDLGFVLRELTSIEKNTLSKEGIMVVSVLQNSTISSANIEPGYIIQEINGTKVQNVNDFINLLNKSNSEIHLKGIYKIYPGIFPYVFRKNNKTKSF